MSEAAERAAVVAEARTWLGTPFRDQGDVKGPNGAVDCAMLLVRVFVDCGLVEPFDPRPYPPQWLLHRDEERFLAVVSKLGTEVVRDPLPGDVIVYKVARCFAHGGIALRQAQGALRQAQGEGNADSVLHAYYKARSVVISPLHEAELAFDAKTGRPRPFKLFDLWSERR